MVDDDGYLFVVDEGKSGEWGERLSNNLSSRILTWSAESSLF